MPQFFMAMTINPNAKKEHDDLATQINQSLDAFEANNTKVIKIYATLGRYDCLAVFEANDQTQAFKVASQIMAKGVLDTETWPVIPFEDFTQIIK